MCCSEIQKAFNAKKECFSEKVTSATGEHGRQFLIELPRYSTETFCRIQVDKCLIDSIKVEKCDFVFKRCSNSDFYFIECKGKKIKKGLDQIIATINHFKSKIKLKKEQIFGFIVASAAKFPRSGAGTQANLKKTFTKYGVALKIENKKLIHRV